MPGSRGRRARATNLSCVQNAWNTINVRGSYHIIDGFAVTGFNDSIALNEPLEASKKPVEPYHNTNGIYVDGGKEPREAKPHHVIIKNNTVSKMPGGGITMSECDYITFEDNKVFDNAWFMRYGGSGITPIVP